ncbi:MAG: rhamnulokinase [Armatimonadetes bacterium]|nr:rhamnulokinase [Armatimonadota bacterium]
MTTSLAVDIGAESGRVVAGTLANDKLTIHEIARFPNTPINLDGSLRWNIQELIANVRQGIDAYSGSFRSVGVDTWGVDYVLLDKNQNLVEQPYHYRDQRTDGKMDEVDKIIPLSEIYAETGIQFLPFNTIFQLFSVPKNTFSQTQSLLTIPDYILHQLSRERQIVGEYTNATTTQLLNARTKNWSKKLLDALEIPCQIVPKIVEPGTNLGPLQSSSAQLIAPACHDTGSAVVAIPSASPNVAWISSGTWSILGIESQEPIISDETYRLNYTNEGGVCGTVRFCKNVMGLWILQECRRQWDNAGYAQLMAEAQSANSVGSWIDPDDKRFLPPGDMPTRVLDFLRETNQQTPATRGEMTRLILESLALKYQVLIDQLENLLQRKLEAIHIFGGGSQNTLLNQLTANATNRPVIAGPVEATAIGNLLMQKIAIGEIPCLADARAIVRNSFDCSTFEPGDEVLWSENHLRFQRLTRTS